VKDRDMVTINSPNKRLIGDRMWPIEWHRYTLLMTLSDFEGHFCSLKAF